MQAPKANPMQALNDAIKVYEWMKDTKYGEEFYRNVIMPICENWESFFERNQQSPATNLGIGLTQLHSFDRHVGQGFGNFPNHQLEL